MDLARKRGTSLSLDVGLLFVQSPLTFVFKITDALAAEHLDRSKVASNFWKFSAAINV
jgi:hypothetical protein